MSWNTLRSWLKPSPYASKKRTPRQAYLNVEVLEARYAPAFTVGPNINITKSAGDDAENAIVVNPTNPLNLFATSTGTVAHKYSLDGGATWQNSDFSSIMGGVSQGDEQMAWDSFGNLFITYFAGNNTITVVGLSIDGGATFQLSLDTGSFYDQPSIAVGAGSVWVCYDTSNQAIRGAAVTGLGQVGAWGAEQVAPGTSGQFGDIAVGPLGQVLIVYQESTGEAPSRIFANLDADGLGAGGLGAQIVVDTTNVGTFDFIPAQPNRSIDAEANLAWDRSGLAHNGRVYLVFADETVNENSDTEIFVRFSDNNGTTWSPRIRVNDDVVGSGRSQFQPGIALDQTTGNVALAFYDARNDANNQRVEVWGSVSTDGGMTFEPNQKISQGSSITPGGEFDFGDYNKADFHAGKFYYAWGDNSNSTGDNPAGAGNALDIYTAVVTVTGGGGGGGGGGGLDPTEPNDRSDMATKLGKLLTEIKFDFVSIKNKPALDQDWYRFEVTGTGSFTITVTIKDPTKDLDIRLWTTNSKKTLKQLARSAKRQPGGTETITWLYKNPKFSFFVQVYGYAGAQSPYEITFTPS